MSRNEIGNDFEKYTTAKTLDQKAACKQCHKKDYESFSYSALTQYISDRIVLITLFSVLSFADATVFQLATTASAAAETER